jgi:hypothetical protein
MTPHILEKEKEKRKSTNNQLDNRQDGTRNNQLDTRQDAV